MPLQGVAEVQTQGSELQPVKKQAITEAADFLNILSSMVMPNQQVEQNDLQMPTMNPGASVISEASKGIIGTEALNSMSPKSSMGFAILGEDTLVGLQPQSDTLSVEAENLLNQINQDESVCTLSDQAVADALLRDSGLSDKQIPSLDVLLQDEETDLGQMAEDEEITQAEQKGVPFFAVKTKNDEKVRVDLPLQFGAQPSPENQSSLEKAESAGLAAANLISTEGKKGMQALSTESGFAEADLAKELETEMDGSVEQNHNEGAKVFTDFLPRDARLTEESALLSQQGFQVAKEDISEELPKIIESQLRDTEGNEIKKEILIQLEPKDLGKLLVKLTEQDGVISVKIVAEHLDTKQLVESGIFSLRESLAEQGIKYGQVDVESETQYLLQQEQEHHHQQQQQQHQPQLEKAWNSIFSEELWQDSLYSPEESSLKSLNTNRFTGSTSVDYVV